MRPLRLALAAAVLAAAPLVARAQTVTVLGGGAAAEACSRAAIRGDVGAGALYACDQALGDPARGGQARGGQARGGEALVGRDLAGTYVNRGVLRLLRREYTLAQADFDRALAVDPSVGESYVNRGAALIAQRRYADGVADIDRGLALHPTEPEKAYFNRALAREGMGDEAAAYADFRTAAALKPAWPEPQAELTRFTVTRRPAG